MQPWSFKSIPKDARISREGMRVYYMNQQQEVLTFCPKAISSWGQHPPFHKNLGLAEGLAEMVTTFFIWFICKNLFQNRVFTNWSLFSKQYVSFWWDSGDSSRYSPIPAVYDFVFLVALAHCCLACEWGAQQFMMLSSLDTYFMESKQNR